MYDSIKEDIIYNVVIVGMGPAGLTATQQALRKGHNVALLEKRSEAKAFIRPNVVVVQDYTKATLLNMITPEERLYPEDIKFLDNLLSSAEVKISAIQKYILNRIKNLNHEFLDPDFASVDLCFETSMQDIDLKSGSAKVIHKEKNLELKFSHLVAADGANANTLQLANKNLTDAEKILRKTPHLLRFLSNTYHITAYLEISLKDDSAFPAPRYEFTTELLKDYPSQKNFLYFLRFDQKSWVKNKEKSIKVGFIAEVPPLIGNQYNILTNSIKNLTLAVDKLKLKAHGEAHLPEIASYEYIISRHKQAQRAIALKYAASAIAQSLDTDKTKLKIQVMDSEKHPEKNHLNVLGFKGGNLQANKAVTIASGHALFLIGDSYFTPNYPIGHGLNDCIESAVALSNILVQRTIADISKGRKEIESYKKLLLNNAIKVQRIMQVPRIGLKTSVTGRLLTKYFEKVVHDYQLKGQLNLPIELADLAQVTPVDHFINAYFSFDHFTENDINNLTVIEAWQDFIESHPTISKQYSKYILENITHVYHIIPNNLPKTATAFENFYDHFICMAEKYNQDLIDIAQSNPNYKFKTGHSVLQEAVECGSETTIKTILKMGAAPNETTIFSLKVINNPSLRCLLFEFNAMPTRTNSTQIFNSQGHTLNYTPLNVAIFIYNGENILFALDFIFTCDKYNAAQIRQLNKTITNQNLLLIRNTLPQLISPRVSRIEEYLNYPENIDAVISDVQNEVIRIIDKIIKHRQHTLNPNRLFQRVEDQHPAAISLQNQVSEDESIYKSNVK